MARKVTSISELIGETPLIRLNRVVPDTAAEVYVKLESLNVSGSVKDRIAVNMIEVAEEEGTLGVGDTIIEATDGNTGISIAMLAAAKDYQALLVMPEYAERSFHLLLEAYGAEVITTPGAEGMAGAIARAEELAREEGYFYPRQFQNPANPSVHEATTAPEIVEALGKVPDAFVSSVGTGGTLTGVGRALRSKNPNVELYAVEPEEAQVLSDGSKEKHGIPGMAPGFIPPVLDVSLYNGVVRITTQEAVDMTIRLAKEEGLLLGTSSGAAVAGAIEVAKKLGRGKTVVTVSADGGDRYLFNQ